MLCASAAVGQASVASLSGTYTLLFGGDDAFSIQTNMFGQQVGFCLPGTQLPYGYSCQPIYGQDVLTGSLIADGKGNITTGSTYVYTADPKRAVCTSKFKATPDCPYKVPFGTVWNNTTAYVVGDEADFTVGSTTHTYQAVVSNTGVAPNTSLCTQSVQPPNCDWVQLYASATGQTGNKGTVTGTYTVQSTGSGVISVTAVSGTVKQSVAFAFTVPSAPLAVGQVVPIVAMPTLQTVVSGSGALVRAQ